MYEKIYKKIKVSSIKVCEIYKKNICVFANVASKNKIHELNASWHEMIFADEIIFGCIEEFSNQAFKLLKILNFFMEIYNFFSQNVSTKLC